MGAVLIAGCGYVGSALATRLVARGEKVLALRRSTRELPEGVVPIAADLRDRAALRLPRDVDRLVYAVGPDGGGDDAYRGAYVTGLENVRDALREAGADVRRAVLTTSTAVYAQDDGGWVDESSDTSATGTARWLLEGERVVREGFAEGVTLRLAGIYGPGRDRMVRMVAEGTARLPRAPRWTNRIHRDDAASAIERLLEIDAVEPAYVGVDDEPTDLADVYRWVAAELGMPEPPFEESAGERGRGTQKRCRNARLRATGWAPLYPTFREGYRDAIAARR
ncbi:SDR family oxidoreductase [Sandaracinus amylolyticus]|uniref:SDR family oxidoreductase n=1 Tax=Sandaracinus amylolyticus TaxID=927083 RepID=UPI001F379E11|nr:SDR family oxidoreductase [Sandaracinus amylolyticus]UJR79006.1 Nucleoside-diphosphate-sugar epimerase [Sandaracinus amylolyticus]